MVVSLALRGRLQCVVLIDLRVTRAFQQQATYSIIFLLSPIQNPLTAAPDCLSTDNPLIAVVGGTPDCSEMAEAKLSAFNWLIKL